MGVVGAGGASALGQKVLSIFLLLTAPPRWGAGPAGRALRGSYAPAEAAPRCSLPGAAGLCGVQATGPAGAGRGSRRKGTCFWPYFLFFFLIIIISV